MKKFLLLVFATLSIASCTNKYTIGSSNSGNSTENNNDSIVSKQNEDTYTIRFLNDEGSLISTKQYEFGVMPVAPDTPSKENPLEGYTYTFSGWSPSIALVTANADYVATYEVEAKVGEVVWVDGNGETLLTEKYAYGSMPNYHGDIPTKTPTDTETYVFKGWSPAIEVVSKPAATYVATFNVIPIIPETQYSIQINCTGCLVNKKRMINEKFNPLTDLTYQFNKTSEQIYHHYPYKLDVTVDGVSTNDYTYDSITGKLNIRLIGDTIINAIADNSCVLMKYKFSVDYPTVKITCYGNFERVDWGDGTIDTNKSHTYSYSSSTSEYDIRVFGGLRSIGTDSNAIISINIFHSVTSIESYAFRGCSSLTNITIPDSVTSIGKYAFRGCSSLTSIIIPNSVTSIGEDAFDECSSLTIFCETESKPSGWHYRWDVGIRSVVWGYIGKGEYDNFRYGISSIDGNKSIVITGLIDEEVTSATIPSTINVNEKNLPVTSICYQAFAYCSSLTNITIPDSVTSIGESAFYECSSLADIVIPNSVTSIGYQAFAYCSSLTTLTIPSLFDRTLQYYCSGTNVQKSLKRIILTNCTSIGDYAFDDCSYLTNVTIPNSVTSIESYAFRGCSSLTNITIPDSVTSIGEHTFDNCSSFTSITIPNSVASIGSYAFYGCSSLTNIIIPNSVISIGEYVFDENATSFSIFCEAESKPDGWDPNWDRVSYDYKISVVWGYTGNGEHNNLKYAISSIGGNKSIVITGLSDQEVTSVIIPSTINVMGEDISVTSIVLCGCFSLTDIVIPGSVTSICDSAFYWCKSLTDVTIPESVTLIGYGAFARCSSLTNITIPNSVVSIGEYAFARCSSLALFDLSNLDHVIDIESDIFSSSYIPTIKVKNSMLEKYQTDSNWSQYSDYMVGV